MTALAYDTLVSLLDYEPTIAMLLWKERPSDMFAHHALFSPEVAARKWNQRYAGKPAFTAKVNGYPYGRVLRHTYLAHRVAWVLHHRSWPDGQIDHINGDRSDYRMENLRCVTDAVNKANTKRPAHNTSGAIGVSWSDRLGKWHAYINKHHRRINLGWYLSFDDAVAARARAQRVLGFHPNHGRG